MSVTQDSHSGHATPMTPERAAPPVDHINKIERMWRIIAVLLLLGSAVLATRAFQSQDAFHDRQIFFRAYLFGFWPCLGLTLGSMALLMVSHVTGGKWGVVIRRILEASTRNFLLVFAMFIPIVYKGMNYLYPWAENYQNQTSMSKEALKAVVERMPWMQQNWVSWRAIIMFAIWGLFIWLLNKWSLRLDAPIDSQEEYEKLRLRFMRLSAGGLVVYSLTISLAGIDWVMSLNATFYSTIWGMIYMVGPALGALSFTLINVHILSAEEPMKGFLCTNELHDNGKLLLAFVMLYTYLNWSQFLIIWSGNLLDEIPWYKMRMSEGWQVITYYLVIFHFAIPFLALLNRHLKQRTKSLAAIAMLLLVSRWVDYYWHIMPNFADENPMNAGLAGHFHMTVSDFVLPAAMISMWLASFYNNLKQRPLFPVYHHLVPEIMEPSHGAH